MPWQELFSRCLENRSHAAGSRRTTTGLVNLAVTLQFRASPADLVRRCVEHHGQLVARQTVARFDSVQDSLLSCADLVLDHVELETALRVALVLALADVEQFPETS